MTPERWQEVKKLLAGALVPPGVDSARGRRTGTGHYPRGAGAAIGDLPG